MIERRILFSIIYLPFKEQFQIKLKHMYTVQAFSYRFCLVKVTIKYNNKKYTLCQEYSKVKLSTSFPPSSQYFVTVVQQNIGCSVLAILATRGHQGPRATRLSIVAKHQTTGLEGIMYPSFRHSGQRTFLWHEYLVLKKK